MRTNKKKEEEINYKELVQSFIPSLFRFVFFCMFLDNHPTTNSNPTVQRQQLCCCDQNLASFQYFSFKRQKFIRFSLFNSHFYLAHTCGGFVFKSVGETPSLAMKKGAKLIFIPFQHLSCLVGTVINQHEHCQQWLNCVQILNAIVIPI